MHLRTLTAGRAGWFLVKATSTSPFSRFVILSLSLPVQYAILDGEIVCLDKLGRSLFDCLFYRQGTPYFNALDLLCLNGRDFRNRRLVVRKNRLKAMDGDEAPRLGTERSRGEEP